MSKYFSVVILDGISTTACIYMASDCAHEEIIVFVEPERHDQSVQLTFVFCLLQVQFSNKHRIPRLMAPKFSEFLLPKKLGSLCVDDKPMAFLVTGVAGTNLKVCFVFFPHQANVYFNCRNFCKNMANLVSDITQIAANSLRSKRKIINRIFL